MRGNYCYTCGTPLGIREVDARFSGRGCPSAPLICSRCHSDRGELNDDGTMKRSPKIDVVRAELRRHLAAHREAGDFDNLEYDRYTAVWGKDTTDDELGLRRET